MSHETMRIDRELRDLERRVAELEKHVRVYPCSDCGVLRSKDEGGTTFTVCDECWDAHVAKGTPNGRP